MDNIIKTLAYAGLGLAAETNEKIKERFEELVEAGKKKDAEGKNMVGDFFKTVESSKEDFGVQFDKMKEKAGDWMPFLKEKAEDLKEKAEEYAAKAKETVEDLTDKAKEAFSGAEEKIEDAVEVK